jgi:hypothetical protein
MAMAFTILVVKMTMHRLQSPLLRCLTGAVVLGLSACAAPPPRGGAPAAAASSASSASVAEVAGTVVAAPEPAPIATAPAPPAALSPQDVQRAVATALEALQGGQEDQAEQELRRVLQQEPNHRLAMSLMRQIKDDPQALLGRESFTYRVQPGETLSRIAQRFMNDLHLFYALARYNGIKVPKALAGGQMIRVPGKAPPPSSVSSPAASRPQTADVRPATDPAEAATEAAAAKASKQKADAVARQTRAARSALAKQDLDGALRAWDAVLELEPDNRTAVLERQKVVGLKDKLGKVK